MINGMVELATMSGRSAIRERVDFAAMLDHCAETFRLRLEQKRIDLRVEIAADLPPVYAEAEQLERVTVNLLSNAANHTQNGAIALSARADEGYVIVSVRDTGEGIRPDILPRVFERGISSSGGKGYGLSICKTIAEAHGGAIEIESEQGKGTSVTFTLPVYGGQGQ
jgi:signal transduction histidine kinase